MWRVELIEPVDDLLTEPQLSQHPTPSFRSLRTSFHSSFTFHTKPIPSLITSTTTTPTSPPLPGSLNLPAILLPPNTPTMASTMAPIPRGTVPRPRPMSLPPPTYSTSHSGTSADRSRQYADQSHSAAHRPSQRGVDPTRQRTTNRILGDYTLSKTLGAGSMGKVKLAHHNITGEKVCRLFVLFLLSALLSSLGAYFSFPTPSFLGFAIYYCITLVASPFDIRGCHPTACTPV